MWLFQIEYLRILESHATEVDEEAKSIINRFSKFGALIRLGKSRESRENVKTTYESPSLLHLSPLLVVRDEPHHLRADMI